MLGLSKKVKYLTGQYSLWFFMFPFLSGPFNRGFSSTHLSTCRCSVCLSFGRSESDPGPADQDKHDSSKTYLRSQSEFVKEAHDIGRQPFPFLPQKYSTPLAVSSAGRHTSIPIPGDSISKNHEQCLSNESSGARLDYLCSMTKQSQDKTGESKVVSGRVDVISESLALDGRSE